MSKKKTHNEFIDDLMAVRSDIEVLGKYDGIYCPLLVKYNGWLYYSIPKTLLRGNSPSLSKAVDVYGLMLRDIKNVNPNIVGVYSFDKISNLFVVDSDGFVYKGSYYGFSHNKISIQSCVDKNSFIKFRFNKVHGDKYDYSKVDYTGLRNKIDIICNKHGLFSQNTNHHLGGHGCPECAKQTIKNKTSLSYSEFLSRAMAVHGDKYDYSKVDYVNTSTDVEIICPLHGSFFQTLDSHVRGSGCFVCGYERQGWTDSKWHNGGLISNNFDSFKVYIIRCWNDNEEFYKIGKTYELVKVRFGIKKSKKMPYNYEVVKIIDSKDDGVYISKLERRLHNLFYDKKYTPCVWFEGSTECFSSVDINLVDQVVNNKTGYIQLSFGI